jgi:hypothetical protein
MLHHRKVVLHPQSYWFDSAILMRERFEICHFGRFGVSILFKKQN